MEMSEIREAVARGWCHPRNSAKIMDTDLAEAISEEIHELLRVECPGCKSGRPDLIYHSSHCPVYKAAHQQQA
jgi:hypothetical protein